jgi:hypothetical protein
MRPLTEDTIGDKVLRFVLGAVLGAAAGWSLALWSSFVDAGNAGRFILAAAVLAGVLGVLFGNTFLEGLIRGRWWNDWWD